MKQDPASDRLAPGWPFFMAMGGAVKEGAMVDYNRFLGDVETLDFIGTHEMADSAIKAVLGVLASSVLDEHARALTDSLPPPLTYERLRGRNARSMAPSLDEFIEEVGAELKLDHDQAHRLVDTVFHTTKAAVGEDIIEEIEDDLPDDVADELERS